MPELGVPAQVCVFCEVLPGWPADDVAAMVAAGGIPARDRPDMAGPVRVSDVSVARAGDHVRLAAPDPAAIAAARARGATPWVLATTPAEVREAAAAGAGVWLRGIEAGGLVAPYTALILMRAVRDGVPFVAEGLSQRAMAAAVAVGAAGVVLDAALWGLPVAPLSPAARRALASRPTGRDTAVLGELLDRRARVLLRGRGPATDALRRAVRTDAATFAAAVTAATEGWWARDDVVIPAPQHIGDAGRFAGRSNGGDVVRAVRAAIEAHLDAVADSHPLRPGRDPLGTGAPIVQGPMANVTERPTLGARVRVAGGMPFVALGALAPERAEAVLAEAAATLPAPWGAGVIAFEGAPHRDAHLALARRYGAAAITLAGGSPELAVAVAAGGAEAWLHTPSGRLAALALRQGVRTVILEGHEAGGHVGALTSVGLWEEGLEAVEAHAAAGQPARVVLAGGVGDSRSAAFAAAMAAPACRAGAEAALQVGTALFFTRDIVEAGQLTPLCQAIAVACDRTLLVGSTANLPLRCAPNGFVAEARAEEAAWEADGVALADRRERLERRNVGRTRIAARGIERHPDFGRDPAAPRYRPVPAERQRDEGAFTLGLGATVTDRVVTVADVMRALTTDAAARLDAACRRRRAAARWGPVRDVDADPGAGRAAAGAVVRLTPLGSARPRDAAEPIAIVGLGCVLPRAHDLPAYWRNLVEGVDAIGEVPADRWPLDRYFDARAGPRGPAKSRSRLAGAVGGFAFDPVRFRIPPRVAATMDPAQRLALVAAAEALDTAGWLDGRAHVDGRRAAVILGNAMGGEYAKSLALRVRYRDVLALLRDDPELEGLDDAAWAAIAARLDDRLGERLPPLNVNSMAGVLANVIAGRVAAWLDWMGGNFTVDAACASSLAAVAVAVDWLRNRRVDAVLTGGVDTDLSPETYVGFSLTGALTPGRSRPFAAGADGFVMGEGGALLLLKRLEDAVRDGDPVWAVIRGVGQSSDGRGKGITAPRAEGQRLALARAYEEAGVGPDAIGLVEAHGTGTTVGDRTEVEVLREAWRDAGGRKAWLGSVKSMLGHLKGGAGAASLTKAALAVLTGVVPPTLHAGPVSAELGLAGSPFRLPRAAVRWADAPRRAAVSAFGFGGTNFHVVLEAPPDDARPPAALPALIAAAAGALDDPEAAAWPMPGDAAPAEIAGPTRHGVLVLVPGQGAQKRGAVASLRRTPAGAAALAEIEAALPERLAGLGLPGELDAIEALAADGRDPLAVHVLLVACAIGWAAVLRDAGVPVAGAVGHSLGEIGALVVAGRLSAADALTVAIARGAALRDAPPGAMLAVSLPPDDAAALADAHGLVVAVRNGPAACVLAGAPERIEAAAAASGGMRLSVGRAYHSPAVAPARARLRDALAAVTFPPGAPVWSVRTTRPFGDDPADDLVEALVDPVRFDEAVAAAVRGVATIVELGPGRILSRHAADAAPGARPIALDPTPGDDGQGLAAAAAALAAAGFTGLAAVAPPVAVLAAPEAEADDPVRAAVVAAVCEVTGYAPDALVTGADLEAELGVDSIRKMEILGLLQERLGFRAEEREYASLARIDLDGLVAFVRGKGRVGAVAIAPAAARLWAPVLVRCDAAPPTDTPLPGAGFVVTGGVARAVVPRGADAEVLVADALAWARGADRAGLRGLVVAIPDDDAAAAALAGFVRSLGREWGVPARVIRYTEADPALAAELAAADRPETVVLGPDGARREVWWPARGERVLPERPFVVATGGLTGILTPCLLAWAPLRPRVLVLARTGPDDPARGEAVRAALARLAAAGLEVRLAVADVTDADAVAAAIGAARADWGPVRVVLHGAAALRDGLVDRLGADDVAAAFAAKWRGANVLVAATLADAPALFVGLSSLAAERGNAGQTLYAAANAALGALRHPTAARSVAVAFTAWAEVGMAATAGVERLLRARGVVALPPDVGGAALLDALGVGAERVLVTAQELPEAAAPPWPLGAVAAVGAGRIRIAIPLDPARPALADHRVGRRPLVPAAVWVCAIAAAARLLDGAAGPVAVDDFRVVLPTFVEHARDDVYVEVVVEDGGRVARIVAGDAIVAAASVRSATPPPHEASPLDRARPAAGLYRADVLFHGPAWRVLRRVAGDGNGGARAELAVQEGMDAIACALDGVHQLLSAWSGHTTGWLGVPVGAARWIVGDPPPTGRLRVDAHAERHDDGVVAQAWAVDELGRVVLYGESVRLRQAARWPADAPDALACDEEVA